MKTRPGKKVFNKSSATNTGDMVQEFKMEGFNICHDAHTEWLPSEKEIEDIILSTSEKFLQPYEMDKNGKTIKLEEGMKTIWFSNKLATAIRKLYR